MVPTWNYLTVHAYGSLVVHDDPAWTRDVVSRTTALHEQAYSVDAAVGRLRGPDAARHRRDRDPAHPGRGEGQDEPEQVARRRARDHRRPARRRPGRRGRPDGRSGWSSTRSRPRSAVRRCWRSSPPVPADVDAASLPTKGDPAVGLSGEGSGGSRSGVTLSTGGLRVLAAVEVALAAAAVLRDLLLPTLVLLILPAVRCCSAGTLGQRGSPPAQRPLRAAGQILLLTVAGRPSSSRSSYRSSSGPRANGRT